MREQARLVGKREKCKASGGTKPNHFDTYMQFAYADASKILANKNSLYVHLYYI